MKGVDAHVVHDAVEPAKATKGSVEALADDLVIVDRADYTRDHVAPRRLNLADGGLVTTVDHDPPAPGQQSIHDPYANPPGRAGDQVDAVRELGRGCDRRRLPRPPLPVLAARRAAARLPPRVAWAERTRREQRGRPH